MPGDPPMPRLLTRLLADRRAECAGCGATYDERPRHCHACGGRELVRHP